MKKFFCALLAVLLLAPTGALAATALEGEPIQIATKQDLYLVRDNPEANYYLTNDLTFTPEDFAPGGDFYGDGYGWLPIGANISKAFLGMFDGGGHTISGLQIHKAYYNYEGLFGVNGGTVKNLVLTEIKFDTRNGINVPTSTGTSAGGKVDYESQEVWTKPSGGFDTPQGYDYSGVSTARTGGICGYNIGSVENCMVKGIILATAFVGGIAGRSCGTISGCYTCATITSKELAGGIVGANRNHAILRDCYTRSFVSCPVKAGGITGDNAVSELYNCISYADIVSELPSAVLAGATSDEHSELYYLTDGKRKDSYAVAKDENGLASLSFDADCWTNGDGAPYLTAFGKTEGDRAGLPGDVNADGSIDISDLAVLKIVLADPLNPTVSGKPCMGDVNIDGNTDITDLALLKQHLSGIISLT